MPLDCPCCGAAPDTEIALPLARANRDRAAVSALTVDFPYCRSCAAHVARWDSAGVVRSGLIVIGIVTFVVAAFASELAFGVIALIAATTLALGVASSRRGEARRACSPSCGSVGMSVHYLGWSGTATGFAFESIAYGAKFAEQNASRIVDDPRIRKLLQNYKLARIAVPTPAAAIAVIPPPLGVGEWIARLAATSTRVARRSGLAAALETLPEARAREQVVRTVCAIELAAYVAPLDRLSSVAAKRRHLRATIDQIRRDNVPEPLQQALLDELERRMTVL